MKLVPLKAIAVDNCSSSADLNFRLIMCQCCHSAEEGKQHTGTPPSFQYYTDRSLSQCLWLKHVCCRELEQQEEAEGPVERGH